MKQRLTVLWLAALTAFMVPTITAQVQQLAWTARSPSAPPRVQIPTVRARDGVATAAFKQWAKGAPPVLPKRTRATLTERIDALEALASDHQYKLQFIRIIDHVDPNFGHIYGWMFNGVRQGGNTSFWMQQNAGEGAGASWGDDFDRFAMYIEKEGNQRYTGGPTVGLYVANLAQGAHPNHAILAGSAGSPESYGVVSWPNLVMDDGTGKQVIRRREGDQLVGLTDWFMGHSAADAKRLYP